jgi:DNA-binding NarL/FixJ family response regulator
MATILVLDDDPFVAMLIESVVPPASVVLSAPNGLVGLDLLRQKIAKRESIDLIVLDVQMPGLDGYDAAVRIRQLAPRIPMLMLTGLAEAADPDLDAYALELGCALLRKPVPPHALGCRIQAAMQPPVIQWTATLARLQKKALDAEAQARQRRAIPVALLATDPIWLIGASSLLRDAILVVGAARTPDQLQALLAGQRIGVLVVAWQDSHMLRAIGPSRLPPVVIVAPSAAVAQHVQRLDEVAGVAIASDPATLLAAVEAAAAGEQYRPPVSTMMDSAERRVANLTRRECELLAIDRPGVPIEILAQTLGVAPKTIEQYRWRIRGKLEQAESDPR